MPSDDLPSPRHTHEDSPFLGDDDFDLEDAGFPLAALPSLPRPDKRKIRVQVAGGVGVVLWSILLTEGAIFGLAHWSSGKPAMFWRLMQSLAHTEAAIAAVAHINLLLSDPGVVRRDRETCYPLPAVVSERLRAGDALSDITENIVDGDGGSYCVRCCVWRRAPPCAAHPERAHGNWARWVWHRYPAVAGAIKCAGGASSHHCSICQRCVVGHDHHCGVLGRCITANNMPWFLTLLCMGQLAWVTVVCSLLVAVLEIFGTNAFQWAALSAVAYASVAVGVMCCGSRAMARWFAAMRASAAKQRANRAPLPATATRMASAADDLSQLPVARVVG